MGEIDYDRIAKIAEKAAGKAQHTIVKKTVVEVLKVYGIHDPEEMQNLIVYGKRCMEDKREMRKGFLGGLGGHLATVVVSVGAAIAAMKGMGH